MAWPASVSAEKPHQEARRICAQVAHGPHVIKNTGNVLENSGFHGESRKKKDFPSDASLFARVVDLNFFFMGKLHLQLFVCRIYKQKNF